MLVIASSGAMLVIGHKAPLEISAIACRIESPISVAKLGSSRQVSGPSDAVKDAIRACDPNLNGLKGWGTTTAAASAAPEA
jgi:hypothetical protein